MYQRMARRAWRLVAVGFLMGLLCAAVLLAGVLIGRQTAGSPALRWPETVLSASATESSDSMAIATGMIEEGVEGLFVLDFVTGNLQVSVINPRTGQLGGLYRYNVAADLGAQQGKAPKYLLVTGIAKWRSYTGNVVPAQSIVYVADSTSGRYAAYMLPWNREAASYNFTQVNSLIRIGTGIARNIPLE